MSASQTVSRAEQLGWEARVGRPAAAAAFLSSALIFGSVIVQVTQIGAPGDDRETLMLIDKHRADFFLSLGLQAGSYLLLVGALLYLLRATIYRRPEAPRFATGLLILAPVLLAVGAVLNQLALNDVADQFLSSRARHTNDLAKDLIDDRNKLGGAIAQGGTLALALSFVLVSLNAMRAGLLSRFMGVLGLIVGGLLILPLLPGGQSVVQLFWLVALGILFLDRWPGGRGPAWETGEAIPWPSAAELRGEARDPPEPAEAPPSEVPARPVSRKRKRKRR